MTCKNLVNNYPLWPPSGSLGKLRHYRSSLSHAIPNAYNPLWPFILARPVKAIAIPRTSNSCRKLENGVQHRRSGGSDSSDLGHHGTAWGAGAGGACVLVGNMVALAYRHHVRAFRSLRHL